MRTGDLLKLITPAYSRLLLIAGLLLASGLAALVQPWLAGRLVALVTQHPEGWVTASGITLLFLLALAAASAALRYASSVLTGTTLEEMASGLRNRAYTHLQALPLSWHQDRRAGDSLALLTNDALAISGFVTHTLVQLLPALLTLAGALAIMAWIDLRFAALVMVLMPVYYLAMKLVGRGLRPVTRQWIEDWSAKVALVEENINLLPAIKSFGREPVEQARFATRNEALLQTARRQIRLSSALGASIGFMAHAGLLLFLWLGITRIEAGELDAAQLATLLFYGLMVTRPVSALADVYGQTQVMRGAAERLQAFFAVAPEPDDRHKPALVVGPGEVEFRAVNFTYPGREPLFRSFDLRLEAGQTVALTGPNGAGKTTLAHLLLRLVEPQGGAILVDGKDIRDVGLSSLRSGIGLVAQSALLMNASIADNIRYGRIDADEGAVEQAAQVAGLRAFIATLPDGYDTLVGDRGVRLSGGQQQRLSLARTLVTQPRILVLDETTAMFDPDGEESVLQEFSEALAGRTVLLITHRPASLAIADRVLHLENGRITGQTRTTS